jgi:hypothetical protein
MKVSRITFFSVLAVLAIVLSYGATILILIWPIKEFSVTNAGAFGDSFGMLTSFFSGLAFAGVLLTLYIQGKELSLQRLEMAKSNRSQEKAAQLTALIALLEHCKSNIDSTEKLRDTGYSNQAHLNQLGVELGEYKKKRDALVLEIESLVNEKT